MSYALELRDLRKNFGKTEIIRGVNLAVHAGERVAVIGPNGAGKSTLFNLISGRFGPTSGDILLNGQAIQNKTPYEINRMGLSRSFQITNIFPKLSVFENLRCAVLWSLGYKYTFLKFLADLKDANDRTDELMEMIKLDKKRDVLGMALLASPVLLLLPAGIHRARSHPSAGFLFGTTCTVAACVHKHRRWQGQREAVSAKGAESEL